MLKKIAVVGGGINGVMTAWALARHGHAVELFEAKGVMAGTSRASTKLLHGGLRYLEFGQFSLVREGLRERAWWLGEAPHLAHEIRIILPVYRGDRRPAWKIDLGLRLYDGLAGRYGLQKHRFLTPPEIARLLPELNTRGLRGAYEFSDGQMDDYTLGLWAVGQARASGVAVWENSAVERLSIDGKVVVNGESRKYDLVYNVAGPRAGELLARSGIGSDFSLNLVKGSHLILDRKIERGLYVQAPLDSRFVFILPYKGRTLVGTTEIPASLDDPLSCSEQESTYLLSIVSHYLGVSVGAGDVSEHFAGLRPLVAKEGTANPTRESREYAMERRGSLITVFGGKWTTSRALGEKAARLASDQT